MNGSNGTERVRDAFLDVIVTVAAMLLYDAITRLVAGGDKAKANLTRFEREPEPRSMRRWWSFIPSVWRQVGEDNVSILASGVAFYSMLSIFPALTALVSLYGLFADPSIVQQQLNDLRGVLPEDAVSLLSAWLQQLVDRPQSSFGVGLMVSLALSLWGARSATGTMMTALNIAYDEPESRNFLLFNVVALALTVALVLCAIASVALIAVLPAVIGLLPLPPGWQSFASIVRWPLLTVLVIIAIATLYRYAPNRAEPKWEWASAGALVATALWILASYGFSTYVSRFTSFDKTYGSLGAVVVLLMWFWLGAYAVLAGAELNAQIERSRGKLAT